MEVYTNTPKVLDSRKKTLQLLLSNHNRSCLSCVRSGHCELRSWPMSWAWTMGYYDGEITPSEITSAAHMIRDNSKCILCRRCGCLRERTGHRRHRCQQPRVLRPPLVLPLRWVWENLLRILRTVVYCSMSNRSTDREGITPQMYLQPIADPEEACNRSDRSRRTRRTGRGNSGFPSAPMWKARWLQPCAVWALTKFLTPISPQTLPSWRRHTSSLTVYRTEAYCLSSPPAHLDGLNTASTISRT